MIITNQNFYHDVCIYLKILPFFMVESNHLNNLQFFHDKDPDSFNTKVKLEEKLMWEDLIKNLMEE